MKSNFTIKETQAIKAVEIKEDLAMGNYYTHMIAGNFLTHDFALTVQVAETKTGTIEYNISLINCNTEESKLLLTGEYTGVVSLKKLLSEKIRELNTKTEADLSALVKAEAPATNKEIFASLPIGAHLCITFASGRTVEAIKRSEQAFIFNNYGTWKNHIITREQTLDTDFPSFPKSELIQDPYIEHKQWILVRQNFRELVLFQLVSGEQVGKCKMTDDQITQTFDFISQDRLSRILHGTHSDSAARLYALKRDYLEGKKGDWRTDAKPSCLNPDSLGFMAHVGKEGQLIPLAVRTARAMRATNDYCKHHGVKCWWMIPSVNGVLLLAERAGYVSRMSTTQVHWTDKGCEALKQFKAQPTHTIYA